MVIAVSNLKINNVLASTANKITSPFPTLTWEYDLVDRVYADSGEIIGSYTADPSGFEIKIGTTLGGSNLVNTGFVSSSALQWRYKGSTVNRGETIYGQIRLKDSEGNVSDWKSFTIEYNNLPTITSASISPSTPTTHDDLELSYSYSDTDGDVESGTNIWWIRNGIHERQFDNLTTIESKYLKFGDEWSVQIFPSDGYEYGNPFSTLAVEVDDETPVVDGAIILPENATYNDPLYAKYTFTSTDNKSDKSQIKWYVNNSLQSNTTAFARLDLNDGDEVRFEILAADQDKESNYWVSSETITIARPPFVVENLRCNGEVEPLSSTLLHLYHGPLAGLEPIQTNLEYR